MEITEQEKYVSKVVGSFEQQNGEIRGTPQGNISDTTIEESNMTALTKEGNKESEK
jgi:hypothetical protein